MKLIHRNCKTSDVLYYFASVFIPSEIDTHTNTSGGWLSDHLQSPGWQPNSCVAWCLIMWFASIGKSMVLHDTECPYWDQMSSNNTKLKTQMRSSVASNNLCISKFTMVLHQMLFAISHHENHQMKWICQWFNKLSLKCNVIYLVGSATNISCKNSSYKTRVFCRLGHQTNQLCIPNLTMVLC